MCNRWILLCFTNLLLIYLDSAQATNACSSLQKKLNKYHVRIKYLTDLRVPSLRLCQRLTNDSCCPQYYADQIQNATVMELYQLFELHSIRLYEPLLRLSQEFNETFVKLIESARNDTHHVLQRGYHQLYMSYRSSVDQFFHQLLTLTSRSYQHQIKTHVDQLFHDILHISLTMHRNQSILPNYLACLWRNQPFGNSPQQLIQQLEVQLGKLFHLQDLLKLSHELVQVLSTVGHACRADTCGNGIII
jgi:adenylate kinase family enzyme